MSHGSKGVPIRAGCEQHPKATRSTVEIGMIGGYRPWRSRYDGFLGHRSEDEFGWHTAQPWRSKYGIWYMRPITRWHRCECGDRFDFKDTVIPKPKAVVRPDIVQAIRRLKDAKHIFPWEVEWLPKSRSSSAT